MTGGGGEDGRRGERAEAVTDESLPLFNQTQLLRTSIVSRHVPGTSLIGLPCPHRVVMGDLGALGNAPHDDTTQTRKGGGVLLTPVSPIRDTRVMRFY